MENPERIISEILTATEEGSVSPPMGDIYCITSPSGKQYIGQTKYSMEERFTTHKKQDTSIIGCKALGAAAMKYGWENMTLKLIEKCPREKLNEREIYWISHYDTFHNGYNCTIGGAGVSKFWLPFEEAHAFARSLNLSSKAAWAVWSKSGARPDDIPCHPRNVYKDEGWAGYGDWLGTGNVKNGTIRMRPFAAGRAFVRSLGLSGQRAWGAWGKSGARPHDIPTHPDRSYKGKWVSWGDWLGTGNERGGQVGARVKWRPFPAARTFARSLGLSTLKAWCEWSKRASRPTDIPSNPNKAYKDQGWGGYGDFLALSGKWRSLAEARPFARSLNIKKAYHWVKYWKTHERPYDIPVHPDRIYKGKWVSWKDFLGN